MTAEDWLWKEMTRRGELMVCAYNSDVFDLLACILAYYEVRGTPAEQMIVGNETMRHRIDGFKASAQASGNAATGGVNVDV